MPFRARMKKAFGRSDSSSSSNTSSSSLHQVSSRGIGDPKIYQPGEQMPKPKYRAPVDKKHKEKLEAFDFGTAWRPRASSVGSGCSPMGSRLPSRRPSLSARQRSTGWAAVSDALEADTPSRSDSEKKSGNDVHLEFVPDYKRKSPRSPPPEHSPFSQADLDNALSRQHARVPVPTSA